jgi:hypothetical protein
VDEWLQAVQEVGDEGEPSVKVEPKSPAYKVPEEKGKAIFIDLAKKKA